MKNVQMAIGFVSALLLANAGRAENITIVFADSVAAGNGWLPKIASDGQVGMTNLIYQIGTGDARLEYESGMLDSGIALFYWSGPYNIFSSTQPTNEIGHDPSIAMVNCAIPACTGFPYYVANVIQVHQGGQDNGAALWYRTGVERNASAATWAAAQRYDTGYNATVALDQWNSSPTTTTVVEVHQAGKDLSELWYHVGTLTYSDSSVTVTWGPAYMTGFSGYAPAVSISNGSVVLVAQGTAPELWYSTGSVDFSTNTIIWGPATSYGTGYNPTVSMQPCGSLFDCDSVLVEAHQGGTGTGSLWYRIGTMFTGAITWTPNSATKYASSGCYPSVSLLRNWSSGQDNIVESHSDACGGPANIVSSWGTLQLK